jgi:spermidine synthase
MAEFTTMDFMYVLIACIFAILIGVFLAKKQARAFSGQRKGDLPEVNFFDYGDMRFLHLGTPAVQGSMKISKPFEIHLEYVQRMMAWLLLTDLDRVSHMHAMQLGLGAASLTKFCYSHLHMQTTAVELNPHVVETCRLWFHLPDNNAKLQVVLGDAGEVIGQDLWHEKIDILQVDLYDQDAARPVLDTEDFYRDCHRALTHDGCMTVNLFGRDARYDASLKKITAVFGPDAVWAFKPTTAGNTIVLAFRQARMWDPQALLSQAQTIQARWPLPATAWLKVLAPAHEKRTQSGR